MLRQSSLVSHERESKTLRSQYAIVLTKLHVTNVLISEYGIPILIKEIYFDFSHKIVSLFSTIIASSHKIGNCNRKCVGQQARQKMALKNERETRLIGRLIFAEISSRGRSGKSVLAQYYLLRGPKAVLLKEKKS